MASHIIRTGKLTDKAVLAAFDEIAEQVGLGGITGTSAGIAVDLTDMEFRKSVGARERSLTTVVATAPPSTLRIGFHRGVAPDQDNPESNIAPSAFFDEFFVSPGRSTPQHPQPTLEDVRSCIRVFQRHAGVVSERAIEERAESATALLQQEFANLTELQTEMVSRLDDRRHQLEQEIDTRRQELEAQADSRRLAMEQEFDREREILAAQRQELENRAKELNDRDHMHVRRELREKITTEIQGRLGKAIVPPRTSSLRYGVLFFALIGAAALGLTAWYSLTEYAASTQLAAQAQLAAASREAIAAKELLLSGAIWVLLARGSLSALGAVAFLLYAISWLKRVYYDDVRVQRELERYSIDLNRASWAIETIMEAKKQGDVAIPDILVTGVSKNLFEQPHGVRDADTPSDALAAVLRASAKAKIGPSGAEFELNNRGTNKLARELEE